MSRYVAIFETNGKNSTFVVDGKVAVEELFKLINERQFVSGIEAISLHVDQSQEEPFIERVSRLSQAGDIQEGIQSA
ncbi:hypothetical protein [Bradyrhizobium sp. LA2.1]|uniref:hypothetical protein n=1 Tax=Bradyrhizobium sp. LA2.1 TaxID=3156376 RepID=UPI00339915B7